MTSLYCQKCRTALHLDGSLDGLNPASFKILADAAPLLSPRLPEVQRSVAGKERQQRYNEAVHSAGLSPHDRSSRAAHNMLRGSKNPDMSYIMLTESQVEADVQDEALSTPVRQHRSGQHENRKTLHGHSSMIHDLETVMRLFEILSARSDIDHPICAECADTLLDGLQQRQASATKERDAFALFLKHAQQDVPTTEEKAKVQQDLQNAKQRESQALTELETLELAKAKLEDEITRLDTESELLDEQEEQFWRSRNAFVADLTTFKEERDSLQNQLKHDGKILEALERTNVYNDTFCIGHDGAFATINGLRLGRLPDQSVDWSEINAAWGQTLLLLTVVTEKLKFTLGGYELVPVGSTSKVVKLEQAQDGKQKRTILQLYSSGDLPLGFHFLHRNFDSAMVAFLECLRQVGEHVERSTSKPGTPGLKMPHSIVKDKIGNVCIKTGNFGQDEQWTKACKYTLTCCKFLLAHASHVADSHSR